LGFSGDGGPATAARLNKPSGVAVDLAGNLYIADTNNHRIRKVAPGGTISTYAGTGRVGFAGDGGPATAAQLNEPVGVAVDPAGNLYIAERENHRIRKVTPGGVISTYAGTGTQGFSGDGGPATAAQLLGPGGVALDPAGNFYIADRNNDRIRRVTPGGTIATYAGSGSLGFAGDGGPATAARLNMSLGGVALDSSGNLYIADSLNERIRKVTPGGTISTYAGTGTEGFSGDGGPATAAHLDRPDGVAVDSAGNLYIADSGNSRIRKVTPGGTISTYVGNGGYGEGFLGDGGPATAAHIRPRGVALDSAGNLYITDFARIRKVTPGGTISTYAGTDTPGFAGDGGPATAAQLSFPQGVALDSAGNLYIADSNNNRIRKVTPGGTISTYAGTGLNGFSGDGGPAIAAQLWIPVGVALDSAGNLYIADQENQRIRKVTP
jgi:sugar lactone lactonase YvrE